MSVNVLSFLGHNPPEFKFMDIIPQSLSSCNRSMARSSWASAFQLFALPSPRQLHSIALRDRASPTKQGFHISTGSQESLNITAYALRKEPSLSSLCVCVRCHTASAPTPQVRDCSPCRPRAAWVRIIWGARYGNSFSSQAPKPELLQ